MHHQSINQFNQLLIDTQENIKYNQALVTAPGTFILYVGF
jgi:hypothetical protein